MERTAASTLPPRYRDPERIARGAMGEVYRATDSLLGRVVAVKLLSARFLDDEDARVSDDQNIVTIYDVGEAGAHPYIVMEYMPGGSLEDRLHEQGAQPPDVALRWLEQTARALDHAHTRGVVHRDVKPGNLLLDDADIVHVGDFGIASAAGTDSLTVTGTILGTAGYLSPEQARGERATPASDRYALGVVAYELLSGERPFAADSPTAEAAAHAHAPVPRISAHRRLPAALDAVFQRALAKDPAARYPTSADLVTALRSELDRASTAETPTVPLAPPTAPTRRAPAVRSARRSPPWPLIAALIGAAVLAGVVLAVVLPGGSDKEETQAAAPATTHQTPKKKRK